MGAGRFILLLTDASAGQTSAVTSFDLIVGSLSLYGVDVGLAWVLGVGAGCIAAGLTVFNQVIRSRLCIGSLAFLKPID